MTPGGLDQRITIQRVTLTADDMGGSSEVWADLSTVWASMTSPGGSESYQEMRETGLANYKAVVRWQGDASGQPRFTNLDRVTWRGREYNIKTVLPMGRQEWLELVLVEGEAS